MRERVKPVCRRRVLDARKSVAHSGHRQGEACSSDACVSPSVIGRTDLEKMGAGVGVLDRVSCYGWRMLENK